MRVRARVTLGSRTRQHASCETEVAYYTRPDHRPHPTPPRAVPARPRATSAGRGHGDCRGCVSLRLSGACARVVVYESRRNPSEVRRKKRLLRTDEGRKESLTPHPNPFSPGIVGPCEREPRTEPTRTMENNNYYENNITRHCVCHPNDTYARTQRACRHHMTTIIEKADSPTAHNSATHAGVREVNCHAS